MSEAGKDNIYPWYEKVGPTKPLEQGDFISDCPHPEIIGTDYKEAGDAESDIYEYDIIVMSQSCDLLFNKIENVIVSPVYSLSEYGKRNNYYASAEGKEDLRIGKVIGAHLLAEHEINGTNDHWVVDFKHTFSIKKTLLDKIVVQRGNRVRLLPPYREHLSQTFARFVMRVGLPTDIPPFT